MQQTGAHLLLVLLGPVDPTGPGRRSGGADADRDQQARSALRTGHEVENARRQPRAERNLDQGRMQRVTQRTALQHTAQRSQRHALDDALQRLGDRVQFLGIPNGVERLQGPDTDAVITSRAGGGGDTADQGSRGDHAVLLPALLRIGLGGAGGHPRRVRVRRLRCGQPVSSSRSRRKSPNPPRARGSRRAEVVTGLRLVRFTPKPAASRAATRVRSSLTGSGWKPPAAR